MAFVYTVYVASVMGFRLNFCELFVITTLFFVCNPFDRIVKHGACFVIKSNYL